METKSQLLHYAVPKKQGLPIGKPKQILDYLQKTAHPNDPRRFVIDPNDPRRVVVADQKMVLFEKEFYDDTLEISLKGKTQQVSVVRRSPCNPSLVLLEGRGLHRLNDSETIFGGAESIASNVVQLHPDVVEPPPPRTDGATSMPAFQTPFEPLTEYWLEKAFQHNRAYSDKPIVAILDTGIDLPGYLWNRPPHLPGSYLLNPNQPGCPLWYNETPPSCDTRGTDRVGWNFVNDRAFLPSTCADPFDDAGNSKHGTRIAAIIARLTDWNVRLMPLKTHDYRGLGEFFDIFSAFEYVLKHPVQIINASWGYYGSEFPLLKTYLQRLADQGIWMVTAAGNRHDLGADEAIQIGDSTNPASFHYPACYSNNAALKVITVTSIHTRPRREKEFRGPSDPNIRDVLENFSKKYVDVAIDAGLNGAFPEPLDAASPGAADSLTGSSYATAYFSGLLARHIAGGNSVASKSNFIGLLTDRSVDLDEVVRGGRFRTENAAPARA